jgi:hypothetical protein
MLINRGRAPSRRSRAYRRRRHLVGPRVQILVRRLKSTPVEYSTLQVLLTGSSGCLSPCIGGLVGHTDSRFGRVVTTRLQPRRRRHIDEGDLTKHHLGADGAATSAARAGKASPADGRGGVARLLHACRADHARRPTSAASDGQSPRNHMAAALPLKITIGYEESIGALRHARPPRSRWARAKLRRPAAERGLRRPGAGVRALGFTARAAG